VHRLSQIAIDPISQRKRQVAEHIRASNPERMRIVQSGFDKEDLLAKAA
jgi:hypothetical protein